MSTEDEFARTLRDRVDAALPDVAVQVDTVVPRARRRRARTRAVGAGAVALLAVTGVVASQAWAGAPWRGLASVQPAVTGTLGPTIAPEPTATAAPTEATAVDLTGTAQGAAPYWYTDVQHTDATGTERTETWSSTERPGLSVVDGDLAHPGAFGPKDVLGRFRIDGVWVDMLRDPTALPTDPAALEAVLRDSVEPDRTSGSDDDKVFGMVHDLLLDGGVRPTALLRAAVQVAVDLPGTTSGPGEDSTGRPGTVVEYAASTGGTERFVVDPGTGLLLEMGTAVWVVQGPAASVPVEPTLEMSGCGGSWATC